MVLSGQVFTLPGGGKLGYTSIGKGAPVFYFHGTASSRLEVLLLKQLVQSAPLQLIGVDRPGYGLSTYQGRKSLQDFNSAINALADYLGFERFNVLGWSGGGAFCLAYLACFPHSVNRAVIAGAPALPFDGSSAHNTPLARYLMKIPFAADLAMRQLNRQLQRANGDASAFLATPQGKQLLRGCNQRDLAFFNDPEWVTLMYQSMVEAFRQGNVGVKTVVDEHRIFLKPWRLPLEKIAGDKLWIWHGEEDLTCRVSNAFVIANLMPTAKLEIFKGAGHFAVFENLSALSEIFLA